jgi:fimbrial chaperone protein
VSKLFLALSGLALFLAFGIPTASALKVVPFVAEFEPKGAGANQTFQVTNDTDQPAAVQLSMVHRDMDTDGQEKLTDAEDDFTVFPPQMVLLPNEGRAVRVQWLGSPDPKTELTYRLIVEQLPVELSQVPQRGGQVRITVRYETAIYVLPQGAKGDLSVEKAEPFHPASGPNMLALTLRNSGNAHALVQGPIVTVRPASGGNAVTLNTDDQLIGMINENILSGHSRRFLLPWPSSLPVGPLEASLKLAAPTTP